MENLMSMTQHEAGVVVYDTDVVVANWGQYDDGRLPMVAPGGIVFPWPTEWDVAEEYHSDDIRGELPGEVIVDGNTATIKGMTVFGDEFGDIPALWGIDTGLGAVLSDCPTSGTIYKLRLSDGSGAVVIAPDEWN